MFMQAGDAISGQEGTAFATIDGENHEMFYVKSIRATAQKQKADFKALGRRGTQKKTTGWSGTGTMTIYYVTSKFRQMMYDYIKDGKDTYFDIMITNDDPNSTVGKQVTTLTGVNLDEVVMAALDVEADVLDEDVPFTWDGVQMSDKFVDPALNS